MTEIILGPPGTGKTTSLIGILEEELARGTPPDRIGYVSFTRRAAEEAASRACEKFKLTRAQFPHFRTLHSLCFRQLGMKSGDVMEGPRLREFADYARIRLNGKWSEDGTLVGFEIGDRILHMENLARVRCIPLREQYDRDDDSLPWREVERVSRALAMFKEAKGYLDYTDMLSEFVNSRINLGLDVLLVDEAQDLSMLQWRVVAALSSGARRVVIAGDDDQAIYRWAGADVDHLIDMIGDVRVLGQSFRCPPVIQTLAGGILQNVSHRREKQWRARDGVGIVDRAVEPAAVDFSGTDILVLARNTYILREQVEPELRRQGIVYERHGHPSISLQILSAVGFWENLRQGKVINAAEARLAIEYMSAGQGVRRGQKKLPGWQDDDEVTLSALKAQNIILTEAPWYEALDRLPQDEVSYIRTALQRGEKLRSRPRVRISTIHGAKGGQADHVVIHREMARRTHREMELLPEDEARVWYVGVTRTRERLTIVDATTPQECPWV